MYVYLCSFSLLLVIPCFVIIVKNLVANIRTNTKKELAFVHQERRLLTIGCISAQFLFLYMYASLISQLGR